MSCKSMSAHYIESKTYNTHTQIAFIDNISDQESHFSIVCENEKANGGEIQIIIIFLPLVDCVKRCRT